MRRRVSLAVRHGLRARANVLRLRVKTFTGRYQSRTVRFRMPSSRPRADAGPDRKERAGVAVRLNGSRSRLPRRSGRGARLTYRWRLVSAPPGSRPTLVDAKQARATLRTDRRYPGRYIARLTVRARGRGSTRRGVDTVTTTAEAQPRTAVQTFATAGGNSGIAIRSTLDCDDPTVGAAEPCFYANPGSADQLQVLVLDRETLAPPTGYANYNRVYSTDDLAGFASQMSAFAATQQGATCKTYDSTKLVLVALRSGTITDTKNFAAALDNFNVSPDAPSASAASDCIATRTDPSTGPFSLIGVPGTLEGKLWVNEGLAISTATGGDGIAGSMNGYFKEVSDDPSDSTLEVTHGFAYPDAIYFNTRAPGPDGQLNTSDDVFVLGTETIPILPNGEPSGTDGGVSLISFDTVNPVGTLNVEAYATNTGSDTANGIDWALLNTRLGDVMSNTPAGGKCRQCGVALVSYGQVGFHTNEPLSKQFLAVLDKLEKLGVNPDTVARAINDKDAQAPGGYGWFSVLAANGIGYVASSTYANPGQSEDPLGYLKVYSGSLAGMLRRGHAAGLFPATADPTGVMQPDVLLPVIYGEQGSWLLTPALAATTACATDTTGPVARCQATGEEVAFAYIVEQAFGKLFPDSAPSLWNPVGAAATAARAGPRASASQSGGSRSADTLDGDGCATDPPAAPASGTTGAGTLVVDASAVRDVSLILRSTYMSYTATLNTDLVSSVNLPSGAAPFTAADLNCAKSQMLDELAAREQVIALMGAVQSFETNSQTGVDAQLAKVAQDVEAGQMASIAAAIHPQPQTDNSYWARLTMQWIGTISGVVDFFAGIDPIINQAYLWTALFSSAGETIMTTIEGPGGNPSRNLQKWASLAKQLEQEPVDLELQVSDALAAQANGVARTEEILLSGPAMLAATNQAAGTSFNFGADTADVFTAAQNAYYYNVRQVAYQSLWPQAYSATRFSTDGLCQTLSNGSKSCFNPSAGTWSNSSAVSLSQASQATCNNSAGAPFRAATSGTPVGFGQGTEYQALTSVADDGGVPLGIDYVMVETDDLTASNLKTKYPAVADGDIVGPFFQQPSDSVSDQDPDAPPGFYAPDFWFQNLQPETVVTCGGGNPVMHLDSIAGFYDQVAVDDNSWPTAPYDPSTPCKYVTISGGTERAICTFDGTKNQFSDGDSLSATDLVLGVGGTVQGSGMWLIGFGGHGGHANSPSGYHGGGGGNNGVAGTWYSSLDAFQAANRSSDEIWYYVGLAGSRGGSTYSGGSGGASTVIANADLNASATRPCIVADDNAVTSPARRRRSRRTTTAGAPAGRPSSRSPAPAAGEGPAATSAMAASAATAVRPPPPARPSSARAALAPAIPKATRESGPASRRRAAADAPRRTTATRAVVTGSAAAAG